MTDSLTNVEDKPLRPGVVPVLFNLYSLNLFVGRIYDPESKIKQHWSTVEGGIDIKANETADAAARREFREEIGLKRPIFIAALTEPMAYTFDDHARYGGKSLVVLFYGFVPGPRQYLDLDPWDSSEEMAFSSGRFVDPANARKLLKIGADADRQDFCDRFADRIGEVHLALQFSRVQYTRKTARLVGPGILVRRTQDMLLTHGNGYTVQEENTPLPSTRMPQLSVPSTPSFLSMSIFAYNQLLLRCAR